MSAQQEVFWSVLFRLKSGGSLKFTNVDRGVMETVMENYLAYQRGDAGWLMRSTVTHPTPDGIADKLTGVLDLRDTSGAWMFPSDANGEPLAQGIRFS